MNRQLVPLVLMSLLLSLYGSAEEGQPHDHRGHNHTEARERNGRRRPPPTDLYLQKLQNKNPGEFERLHRLREEDPAAFRAALREKVIRRRNEQGRNRPHPLSDEIRALRNADTDEARETAEAELRKKLGGLVDRKMQRREERVDQIREQLRLLEAQHQRDLKRRDEMIEQAMQRIQTRIGQTGEPEKPDQP